MTTMRLYSQAQQYDGFTPRQRVFGRTPKLPIWEIDNPFFEDFTNPAEAPATKTQWFLSVIRQIRQASLNADFSNKLNTALTRMVRIKIRGILFSWNGFFISANRKEKGEKKWLGPGVIIGRFVGKYAMDRFMGSYLEVDLGDMRPTNSLFELIGRDGTLCLHVQSTKFPIRYLVDSATLICLSKMRNELLNRNRTTWANAGAMISPRTFYEPTLSQKIAIRELGVGAFNDSMDHLWNMKDSKREKGTKEVIVELESLIHGHRAGSNSPDKSKNSRFLSRSNYENVALRKRTAIGTDFKIDKVEKALSDFAKQVKTKITEEKQYKERNKFKKRRRSWKYVKITVISHVGK